MLKKLVLILILTLSGTASLPAQEESITITTYYPSPYGSYREVSAYRMKIGIDYSDASYSVSDNNLIVQGNVGIGTESPATSLHIVSPETGSNRGMVITRSSGLNAAHLRYSAGTTSADTGGYLSLYNQTGNLTVHITSYGDAWFNNKVGIGTASPVQKLDVAGNMQANLYYDKEDTTYYVDPNATSNVYRMYVNYTPAAANDVVTKQYADNNYKDPPGQWTCTIRSSSGSFNATASCTGSEKVINGTCLSGENVGGGGPTAGQSWRCYWSGGTVTAYANCCL